MVKYITHLFLCLLLSGCVGGGIIKSHTSEYFWANSAAKTNAEDYTAAWLQKNYGTPTSITRSRTDVSQTVWTYQRERIWAGVMPVVVVPIPIVVPVGRGKNVFILRNGQIIRATQTSQHTVGGAVGFAFGPCGGGFGAFSLEGFPE